MELLIIGGVIAVLVLVLAAGYLLLQQRRSGTVKAVAGPRRGGRAADRTAETVDDGQDPR